METHYFPFGEPLKKVQQIDKTPKKVFVLGVYASAVHARWVAQGKTKVKALAVASEPYIFWKGENAEKYFPDIPSLLGKLTLPVPEKLNGASGRALDEFFLKPLGFEREDAWLCDLLPESRMNSQQKKAIDREYKSDIIKLQPATVPDFDKHELDSPTRRREILQELETSRAETLMLLGDQPIHWFLDFYAEEKYRKLDQFRTADTYGLPREMRINGKSYKVIALCHPRQADRLGKSSEKWGQLHDKWIERQRNSRNP